LKDTWKKDLISKKAPFHALTSYVFQLVIRYKKDFYDKVVKMLTKPIVSALVIFKHNPITRMSYLEPYALFVDGKNVYATLCRANQVEELDSYVYGKLLYHNKLCFSQGERVNMIREAHSSLVVGHFGVGKNPKFWDEHIHYFHPSYNHTKKFNEQVQLVQQTVQEQLRKSQAKYKTRHVNFCIGLKGTNPSNDGWIEIGRVRELYPHFHID
jgi:Lhr-like helicase